MIGTLLTGWPLYYLMLFTSSAWRARIAWSFRAGVSWGFASCWFAQFRQTGNSRSRMLVAPPQ